jgi:hypothetical protein
MELQSQVDAPTSPLLVGVASRTPRPRSSQGAAAGPDWRPKVPAAHPHRSQPAAHWPRPNDTLEAPGEGSHGHYPKRVRQERDWKHNARQVPGHGKSAISNWGCQLFIERGIGRNLSPRGKSQRSRDGQAYLPSGGVQKFDPSTVGGCHVEIPTEAAANEARHASSHLIPVRCYAYRSAEPVRVRKRSAHANQFQVRCALFAEAIAKRRGVRQCDL